MTFRLLRVAFFVTCALFTMDCLLPEFHHAAGEENGEEDGGADAALDVKIERASRVNDEDVALDPPPDAEAPFGRTGTWRLVFDDEFDGDTLDSSKWVPCFPWGSTTGCALVPNPDVWYAPENVSLEGGVLRLRAERRSTTVQGKTYAYASGMVSTAGFGSVSTYRRLFHYGYIEARIRAPSGAGLMSTLWALAPDSKYPPELGVVSVRGAPANMASLDYVYSDATGKIVESTATYGEADFRNDFHVVAVSWAPETIRWFIDGAEVRTAFSEPEHVTGDDLYFAANLQVGARATGAPTESTPFPATLEIDWVRVWRAVR